MIDVTASGDRDEEFDRAVRKEDYSGRNEEISSSGQSPTIKFSLLFSISSLNSISLDLIRSTYKHSMMSSKILLPFLVMLVVLDGGATMAETAEDQCTTALQGVTSCLDFASGKAATPTSQCCTAVTNIREKKPVCLCKFIAETHNGSQQIKSLGIQEAKLLQLPSACKLADTNVSDCPKLLGVPSNSTIGSIFTSPKAAAPTSTTSSPGSSSSTASQSDSSGGFKHSHASVLLGLFPGFMLVSMAATFFTNGFSC